MALSSNARLAEPSSRFTMETPARARSSTPRMRFGFPGATTSPWSQTANVTTVAGDARRRATSGRLYSPVAWSRMWHPATCAAPIASCASAASLPISCQDTPTPCSRRCAATTDMAGSHPTTTSVGRSGGSSSSTSTSADPGRAWTMALATESERTTAGRCADPSRGLATQRSPTFWTSARTGAGPRVEGPIRSALACPGGSARRKRVSTVAPSARAKRSATSVDGTDAPRSIAAYAWRLMPHAAASAPCDRPTRSREERSDDSRRSMGEV